MRFDHADRDRVEEKIASGRLQLVLHEKAEPLSELVKALQRRPVHILAVFDEASIRIRRRGAGRALPMSPFCVRRKIRFEKWENIIQLEAETGEPPFSEFMQLVNEAEGGQRDSTPLAWADAEGLRAVVDNLLQGEAPAAQWLLLADRALPTESGMASVRLLRKRDGQRQVLLAGRDYQRMAKLLRPAFDRCNLTLSPIELQQLLQEGVNLVGAGLLDLIQTRDGKAEPRRVLGLAGMLLAARDYRRRYPDSLIVSVDHEIARLWLRMGSAKKQQRSDLLALHYEADVFVIDCVEVKTTSDGVIADTGERIEHGLEQIRHILQALAEALPIDPADTSPLSAPRCEMLKEVLVRACQSRNISPALRSHWGGWLKALFRQDSGDKPSSILLRGEIVKVLLGSNLSVPLRQLEASPYPVVMRTLAEKEIQLLIGWTPEVQSVGNQIAAELSVPLAEELDDEAIPGTIAPASTKLAPLFDRNVISPALIPLASAAISVAAAREHNAQPSWPPVVNALGMIGQVQAVQQLVHQAKFAKKFQQKFADKLLVGPAGVGKTSLARGISKLLLNQQEIMFNGADLRKPDMLIRKLTEEGRLPNDPVQPVEIRECLIFIDEVHGIGVPTATALLSAMDDLRLTTIEGVTYSFRKVIFVLATTDPGRLTEAFNSRPDKTSLRPYTLHELSGIVWLHGRENLDGFELPREVCLEIAARMRANPRRAVRSLSQALRPYLADRILDSNDALSLADIGRAMTLEAVCSYYEEQGIDLNGLDNNARQFLTYLQRNGATAEDRLKQGLGISNRGDFNELDEYLHRLGLINITAGGRALTAQGRRYLAEPFALRERISRQS